MLQIGHAELIVLLVVFLPFALLPVAAVLDAIRQNYPSQTLVLWILVILLFPCIGPIVYFLATRLAKSRQ